MAMRSVTEGGVACFAGRRSGPPRSKSGFGKHLVTGWRSSPLASRARGRRHGGNPELGPGEPAGEKAAEGAGVGLDSSPDPGTSAGPPAGYTYCESTRFG
jgi:hypothetical protein